MSLIIDRVVWRLLFWEIRKEEAEALNHSRFFLSPRFFLSRCRSLQAHVQMPEAYRKVLEIPRG